MSVARCVIVPCVTLLLIAQVIAVSAQEGPDPCVVFPANSVDNGMGAELGHVREFGSRIQVPPECLSGGRTFIPLAFVALTRVASGSPNLTFDAFLRRPDKGTGFPSSPPTPPNTVSVDAIPIFPSHTVSEVSLVPPDHPNPGNILVGDTIYIDVAIDGVNQGVFVTADQTGPPGETPCFTGLDGALPTDPCTNGNPNLNAAGLGVNTYTYYGRYNSGAQVMGREPLASTWPARYLAPPGGGGRVTDLRLREGPGGPVVCEFFNIPDDFGFTCPVTPAHIARLAGGGMFVEVDEGGPPQVFRLDSAAAFLFTDGFESGDTSAWSSKTP